MSIIIGCSNSKKLAKNIAKKSGQKYSELTTRHFPDGELYVRLNTKVKSETIIFVQSFYPSNEAVLEVLYAAYTTKELGAKKMILVAPYMAYMRQDKRFNEGESISSLIIGKLFSIFDEIITIDPHLHRHKNLDEVFNTKTKLLTANTLIQEYILKNFKNPFIVGPDGESSQWAGKIAKAIGFHSTISKKTRLGDRKVITKLQLTKEITSKEVIIIDDIISTGHTILNAINKIKKFKPKSINVIAVHGIFADKKVYELIKKETKSITTTDTINNKHSKISVADLITNYIN